MVKQSGDILRYSAPLWEVFQTFVLWGADNFFRFELMGTKPVGPNSQLLPKTTYRLPWGKMVIFSQSVKFVHPNARPSQMSKWKRERNCFFQLCWRPTTLLTVSCLCSTCRSHDGLKMLKIIKSTFKIFTWILISWDLLNTYFLTQVPDMILYICCK